MHQTLTIPQHRDPVARAALVACALALCWLAITSALPPVQAQEQPETIILVATPTPPALPTEAPVVAVPALAAATAIPPTFVPRPFPTEAPPAVVVAVPAQEAPHVGERPSLDKAGPGERKAPPVVRH